MGVEGVQQAEDRSPPTPGAGEDRQAASTRLETLEWVYEDLGQRLSRDAENSSRLVQLAAILLTVVATFLLQGSPESVELGLAVAAGFGLLLCVMHGLLSLVRADKIAEWERWTADKSPLLSRWLFGTFGWRDEPKGPVLCAALGIKLSDIGEADLLEAYPPYERAPLDIHSIIHTSDFMKRIRNEAAREGELGHGQRVRAVSRYLEDVTPEGSGADQGSSSQPSTHEETLANYVFLLAGLLEIRKRPRFIAQVSLFSAIVALLALLLTRVVRIGWVG